MHQHARAPHDIEAVVGERQRLDRSFEERDARHTGAALASVGDAEIDANHVGGAQPRHGDRVTPAAAASVEAVLAGEEGRIEALEPQPPLEQVDRLVEQDLVVGFPQRTEQVAGGGVTLA